MIKEYLLAKLLGNKLIYFIDIEDNILKQVRDIYFDDGVIYMSGKEFFELNFYGDDNE